MGIAGAMSIIYVEKCMVVCYNQKRKMKSRLV